MSVESFHPPLRAIRWRNWPLRESYLRTSLLVAGLVAVGLIVLWVTSQPLSALLAVAVLVAALWRYWVPIVYELNEEGLDQWLFGRRRCIAWHAIRSYEICDTGVLLLPGPAQSPLASLSGLFLPWSTHREDVLAMVRGHLDRRQIPIPTESTLMSTVMSAGQGNDVAGDPPQPVQSLPPPREAAPEATDLSESGNAE